MTFWKISDTRMNCLITEAEIIALGYSLEDLTNNTGRTEEFLNLLLKKGKEVLGLNTDNGLQGFYGAFLPDRSLMLSISCQAENSQESTSSASAEFSGMLIEPDNRDKETTRWQILFPNLDNVIDFCKILGPDQASQSRLYKDGDIYYLMVDFPNTEDGNKKAQRIVSAGEFGGMIEKDAISEAYLNEHEKCLLNKEAVDILYKM
ncbi:MAG: adaptor protein MecA [Lachnospiraceae bacterium]|nr:adaptor protein MecA [Lachnospiraceae bacterium]